MVLRRRSYGSFCRFPSVRRLVSCPPIQILRRLGPAVLSAIVLLCSETASARGETPESLEYRRFVQPLLAERCLGCHSQAVVGAERADTDAPRFRADRLATGAKGEIDRRWITPGDPQASELWRRVASSDAELRMPPPDHGSALTSEELARLELWIAAGAEAEPFWADQSPQAYLAAKADATTRERSDAALDPVIDGLLENAWKDAGVAPTDESTPEAWLRRVTFTLTGLPPTIAELDQFLADDAVDARERAVDRLLASPRFGERMAALWLDAARYADTHGYHADAHRDQWRWRDWVIDAFNANLPYDRFVLDQIAGDLTDAASSSVEPLGDAVDRRLATGFLRNHMINFEDGAFADEYRAEYVADRVHTVTQAFLGTTLSCARCHDHPYDPITTEQYYQFFAFFNSIDEQGLDGDRGNAAPVAAAPTRQQRERLAESKASLAEIDRILQDREEDFVQGQRVWERRTRAEESFAATPTDAIVRLTFDEGALEELGESKPGSPAFEIVGTPLLLTGVEGSELLVDGNAFVACILAVPLDVVAGASVCGSFQPTSDEQATLWELAGADDSGATKRRLRLVASPQAERLRLVLLEDGEERAELAWKLTGKRNAWVSLAVRFGGVGGDSSIEAFADGKALVPIANEEKPDASQADVAEASPRRAPLDLSQLRGVGFSRFSFGGAEETDGVSGIVDDAALFDRGLTLAEIDAVAGGNAIADALSVDEASRTESQRSSLAEWYRRNVDPIARELLRRRDDAAAELAAANAAVSEAMVARDLPQARATHVLLRGRYDSPAAPVSARSLDFGSFSGEVARPDRLGLAENLIRADHPRTARVAVDRLWRIAFDQGLVATPEDFGLRGQPPLHRELLDRLSVEFVESGWDVKALLRRIVLSRAFALSREGSSATESVDPDNRLFARFPARRLEAEMIVDRTRFVAGTLQERIGGRSVFGLEPSDRWKDLSYAPGEFTAQLYRNGVGDDLYRRAVYTFWKRASPPVTLSLFDVSPRETCRLVRGESRTAMQALAMLNDPTSLDAYRALGCRLAEQNARSEEDRLVELFRLATSRAPSIAEIAALENELASFRTALAANPADVEATLAGGFEPLPEQERTAERAAWSLVATLVSNLPEASEY